MEFRYLPKDKISQLPKTAGIYAFKKGGGFLYIGKAANVRERVKSHFQRPAYRDNFFLNQISKIGYIKTDSQIKALLLEAELIKKYQPKYNIIWRDDKNYFYIGITKESFPRVFITHQPKETFNFIGPFVSGRKLKQALKELRKVYPFRTCKTLPKKPCFWYHLGQCPAPCLFKSRRIEAYDVSNIQGKDATGSMVTFINRKPEKNFYRRFKIKIPNQKFDGGANDIVMLKQVLSRRFNHPEWGLPDLILIDGGKAQLNAALSTTKVPAIALAKRRNELYVKNLEKPILLKALPREVFNLILQLRDEAHRFAKKYHHKLREIDLFQKF
ncbi:hypothetical protein AMJ48_01395 [Parcubacteria bacterium DG_74_1]|nr:MAG: hypothetical protein AMJ48_01395 [Parcubacteria bacterium DG_74_1]